MRKLIEAIVFISAAIVGADTKPTLGREIAIGVRPEILPPPITPESPFWAFDQGYPSAAPSTSRTAAHPNLTLRPSDKNYATISRTDADPLNLYTISLASNNLNFDDIDSIATEEEESYRARLRADALAAGLTLEQAADPRLRAIIITAVQNGLKFEEIIDLTMLQIFALGSGLSRHKALDPRLELTHLTLLKTGKFNFDQIIAYSGWRLGALVKGLTLTQINDPRLDPYIVDAVRRGFEFEKVIGLEIFQIFGLDIGLTPEQVSHHNFSYQHLNALRRGWEYKQVIHYQSWQVEALLSKLTPEQIEKPNFTLRRWSALNALTLRRMTGGFFQPRDHYDEVMGREENYYPTTPYICSPDRASEAATRAPDRTLTDANIAQEATGFPPKQPSTSSFWPRPNKATTTSVNLTKAFQLPTTVEQTAATAVMKPGFA